MQGDDKYWEVSKGKVGEVVTLTAVALQVRVTVLWRGGVGLGKSSTVKVLARGMGLESLVVFGQRLEPVDVLGLPFIEEGETKYAAPWWIRKARRSPTLLFIDEMDKAGEDVRRALLEVLLSWTLGGVPFHPRTVIIGAFNPPECGGRWELSEDVVNRCVLLSFPLDVEGWVTGVVGGLFDGLGEEISSLDDVGTEFPVPIVDRSLLRECARRWRSLVGGFVKSNPSALYLFPRDWGGEPFATPRSWVMAVRLAAGLEAAGYSPSKDERLFRLALEGTVGVVATDEFLGWMRKQDLVPPEEVIANPQALPSSLSSLFLTLANTAQWVIENPTLIPQLGGLVGELERRQKYDLLAEFLRLIASGLRRKGDTEGRKALEGLLKGRKITRFVLGQ